MTTKQIYELTSVEAVQPEDQLLLSTATGNLTRRASVADLALRTVAGQLPRRLAEKMGEAVSVKDFGAKGDGIANDSPAFQAALDQHQDVMVPPGTYRLATTVHIKPKRRLRGAGRATTILKPEAAFGLYFHRNEGAYSITGAGAATIDWCRSTVTGLTLDMDKGGIAAHGHEFYIDEVTFIRGAAGYWCLAIEDANECALTRISAGHGGGANDLYANGIRLWGSETGKLVNYGDSLLSEIAIKLKSPDSIGLLIEHVGGETGETPSGGPYFVMNNYLIQRVQVNSADVPAGTIGVKLRRVMRAALVNVDVEFIDTAFRLEGIAGGGNPGSTRHVNFINCYVLNCTKPYTDSNPQLDGSVMRNGMSGGHGLGFAGEVGIGVGDPYPSEALGQLYTAKTGSYDTFMPGGIWLSRPGNGAAITGMRTTDFGHLLLFSPYQEPPYDANQPGPDANLNHKQMADLAMAAGVPASWAAASGVPKNWQPKCALLIDTSSSTNVARIAKPRGYTNKGWNRATQTWTGTEEHRIEIGNGPNKVQLSGGTSPEYAEPLHRIQIHDPLYLTPWSIALPTSYGGNVPGIVINAANDTPWGAPQSSWFMGPGLYNLRNDAAQGASFSVAWMPGGPRPGFEGVAQFGRGGNAYTMARSDFGKLSTFTNSADSTLTIPAGLIRDDERGGHASLTHLPRAVGKLKAIGAAQVRIVPAAGVSLYAPWSGSTTVASVLLPKGAVVEFEYVRSGSGTAAVHFGAGLMQDSIVDNATLTAAANWLNTEGKYAGKVIRNGSDGHSIMVAQGAAATSPWKGFSLGAGTVATITPA